MPLEAFYGRAQRSRTETSGIQSVVPRSTPIDLINLTGTYQAMPHVQDYYWSSPSVTIRGAALGLCQKVFRSAQLLDKGVGVLDRERLDILGVLQGMAVGWGSPNASISSTTSSMLGPMS